MDIDQYAFCPCGSGKKFKWCCQNIYGDIERAYQQLEQGQQEVGLRIMNEVVKTHAANPEAWGQLAQIQFALGNTAEAEKALEKAFAINPNYPFGLLLQARLRSDEGEFTGALILARKAAEAYHPESLEHVAQVYALIFQLERRRNRPLAAHAALRILIRCQPGDQELRDALNALFGPESPLPECARAVYTFQSPAAFVSGDRRAAWNKLLGEIDSPRLHSLATAFEQLTSQDPNDAAAWYNLAVVQAWLGENRKALDALDKYLPLENNDDLVARAGALAEVLRCGKGMENECDYKQYAVEYKLNEMEPMAKLLQEWHDNGRLLVTPTEEENVLAGMLLEADAPTIITTGQPPENRRLAGYLVLSGNFMRIWGPLEDAINRLREEIRTRVQLTVTEGPVQIATANFPDVVIEALLFPGPGVTPEQAQQRVIENAQKHFEEVWIHRPRRTLAGNTPLDAAGHPLLRKKLLGVVKFMEDCAARGILAGYDFGRLRHKLGLGAAPALAAQPAASSVDVTAMNAGELAAVSLPGLSEEQLEKAFHAAQKLDASEVATRFVKELIARPVTAEQPASDRYPWFSFLTQRAINEGNTDSALDFVNEGEKHDCEHNEGRRRNDYELRRAQLHVKRREADQARDVFTRLIERSPDNMKYRGSAAEGMLSLRQPDRALQFAEEGLAVARRQNDRDSEQYLMELAEAARRQSRNP
jgi:tetratricopeptide (TPR) repeat protein